MTPEDRGIPDQDARLRITRALAGIAAILILVMLIAGNANIVRRWLTGQQIPGVGELIVILLPMSVFAAIPRSEADGVNVKSSVFVDRLSSGPRRVVVGVGLAASAVMTTLLAAATTMRAWRSFDTHELVVGVRALPVWPARVTVALGFVGLLIVNLRQLWMLVRTGRAGARQEVSL